MKTTLAQPDTEKQWFLVDAQGQTLGRLAVKIANILRGRNKPTYTPHVDTGDFVVVINAEKIAVTGKKMDKKDYYMFYSGWKGGEKYRSISQMLNGKNPDFPIQHAVKGMLPKNKLADKMMTKLRIYAGSSHPHEAQNPQLISL